MYLFKRFKYCKKSLEHIANLLIILLWYEWSLTLLSRSNSHRSHSKSLYLLLTLDSFTRKTGRFVWNIMNQNKYTDSLSKATKNDTTRLAYLHSDFIVCVSFIADAMRDWLCQLVVQFQTDLPPLVKFRSLLSSKQRNQENSFHSNHLKLWYILNRRSANWQKENVSSELTFCPVPRRPAIKKKFMN